MKINNYKNKFIAFLDILGFKGIIKEIEESNFENVATFNKIISALNFLSEESTDSNGIHDLPVYQNTDNGILVSELGNPIFTYVSDCIVISTDANFDGFKSLCNKITKFFTDLASDGIFLRGAITYGSVYHDEKFMFGSGYQNAYSLESTKAIFPRIIIDDSVFNYLKKYKDNFPLNNEGMKFDIANNLYYLRLFPLNYYPGYIYNWIDYLLRIKSHILFLLNHFDKRVESSNLELRYYDTIYCWKEKYENFLKMNGNNENILEKYIWISNEFNDTLTHYSIFLSNNFGKLRISKIIFDGSIWRPETKLGHVR